MRDERRSVMQNRDNGWAELQFRRNDASSGNPDGHGNWSCYSACFTPRAQGPAGTRSQGGSNVYGRMGRPNVAYSRLQARVQYCRAPEGRSPQMIKIHEISMELPRIYTGLVRTQVFSRSFWGLRHPPGTDQNRNFGTQLYLDFSSAMALGAFMGASGGEKHMQTTIKS